MLVLIIIVTNKKKIKENISFAKKYSKTRKINAIPIDKIVYLHKNPDWDVQKNNNQQAS